jgi:hypothetical protein
VDATQCNNLMQTSARELMAASACKTDLANDNPLVIQALNGLVAYPVVFAASCLKDVHSKTGSYCFANAVTNTSSTTDSYPFYLPVGQELPAGSRPTCNSVSQVSRLSNCPTDRSSVSKTKWQYTLSTATTLRNPSRKPTARRHNNYP